MKAPFTDVELRAYFASVVGQFRAPFGKRGGGGELNVGQSIRLAQNSTKDRVINVTVTRADIGGAATVVIFTQNGPGAASENDFIVAFGNSGTQRFVLNPEDEVAVTVRSGGPIRFAVGQETF